MKDIDVKNFQAIIGKGIKFLKAKGVTKEEVINLVDQIAEDGEITAEEAADLKRQIKAIQANTAVTVTAALMSGATLIIEALLLGGVF